MYFIKKNAYIEDKKDKVVYYRLTHDLFIIIENDIIKY